MLPTKRERALWLPLFHFLLCSAQVPPCELELQPLCSRHLTGCHEPSSQAWLPLKRCLLLPCSEHCISLLGLDTRPFPSKPPPQRLLLP